MEDDISQSIAQLRDDLAIAIKTAQDFRGLVGKSTGSAATTVLLDQASRWDDRVAELERRIAAEEYAASDEGKREAEEAIVLDELNRLFSEYHARYRTESKGVRMLECDLGGDSGDVAAQKIIRKMALTIRDLRERVEDLENY